LKDRHSRQLPLDHTLWEPAACDQAEIEFEMHRERKEAKDKMTPKRPEKFKEGNYKQFARLWTNCPSSSFDPEGVHVVHAI